MPQYRETRLPSFLLSSADRVTRTPPVSQSNSSASTCSVDREKERWTSFIPRAKSIPKSESWEGTVLLCCSQHGDVRGRGFFIRQIERSRLSSSRKFRKAFYPNTRAASRETITIFPRLRAVTVSAEHMPEQGFYAKEPMEHDTHSPRRIKITLAKFLLPRPAHANAHQLPPNDESLRFYC